MKKTGIIRILCWMSVVLLSSFGFAESESSSGIYRLSVHDADSLVLIDGFTAANGTVEFDLLPQNSSAQAGVLFRYVDEHKWAYVGCDRATDHLGFAHWFVETPKGRTELARDIAKLYAHYRRRIKVNYEGSVVTVYVDGEQIACRHVSHLQEFSGRVGFRVHGQGNVHVSGVECRSVEKEMLEPVRERGCFRLSSPVMEVLLNKDFPSVRAYRWKKDRSELKGQRFDARSVVINGDTYRPRVSGRMESNRAVYVLDVPEIGVVFRVVCEIRENILTLSIEDIEEKGGLKVKTIAFRDHCLVSADKSVSGGCLAVAENVKSDLFYSLREKPVDSVYRYGSIVLLNTDKLAATLESNSLYSTRQFLYRSVPCEGSVVTGIWGNEWIYRGHDGKVTEMPYIKVIVTDDRNSDGKVDWQDGAVALREVYPEPFGADRLRNAYATITMNFASCAQYPFLRQLDNIKKFYLATDGFGQMVELKGYQSEGHDSAHPDYAGNYNERAGGWKDLAFLVKEAGKYNAGIGVHINHSESYPEARAFNDRIVTDMPAWSWLDQSYFINKEQDMLDGTFEKRLACLKEEVPGLAFVYLDTYREYRWLAYRTARLFNGNGWAVWTEDGDVFDKEAVWIHYVPEAKSLIHRFVHHRYRDGYAAHPALLGGYDRSAGIGFMGWQKGRDFKGVIRNFFMRQLPYRYLMHYPVLQLDSASAVLGGGVSAFGTETGTEIRKGDRALMSGDAVFIPWNPLTEEKIYHYNLKGGKTVWQLPASWNGLTSVYLYELGGLGRRLSGTIPVRNGKVEIDARPDQGYVLYPQEAGNSPAMHWGEGGWVGDPGFDSRSFEYWRLEKGDGAVLFKETSYGQDYLEVRGREPALVKQTVGGLTPGREYVASVWANVVGCKEAVLSVTSSNGLSEKTSISESRVRNFTDNTDRFGTTWQRLKIPFRLPEGAREIVLSLSGGVADADSSAVCFDDVRLVECPVTRKEGYVCFEDFEHVDEGWGPFIACQASAFTTHLAQRHGVYTENTIHGDWSLATWRERDGEVYRTSPAMIRFEPEQEYEIEFDYKTDVRDVYRVVGKSLSEGKEIFSRALNRSGKCSVRFRTPACSDFYIVVMKQGNGLLVVDDFGIKKVSSSE